MKMCAMSSMGAAKRRTCCRQDRGHQTYSNNMNYSTGVKGSATARWADQYELSSFSLTCKGRGPKMGRGAQPAPSSSVRRCSSLHAHTALVGAGKHWCMIPQDVAAAAACCTGHVWTLQHRGNSLPQKPLRCP